jgi:dienelactone hydrolase
MPLTRRRLVASALVGVVAAGTAFAAGRRAGPLTVRAEPSSVLYDQVVSVRVTGATPGRPVTVRARFGATSSTAWESHALFDADAAGNVDLATARPRSGTYATVDPTGLLWSAVRTPSGPGPTATPNAGPPRSVDQIVLTAESEGVSAETTVTRALVASGVTVTDVRDPGGAVGRFYQPPDAGPRAAVITLGGGSGGLGFSDFVAAVLASRGIPALALAYFRYEGRPPWLANIPLEYFDGAIDWLHRQPGVARSKVGVLGTSRGGELALLLGATLPRVGAVVAYVPSSVVWPGNAQGLVVPAWTHRGAPLPFMAQPPLPPELAAATRREPVTATLFARYWLTNAAEVAQASIPVERIGGPVLLISGRDDQSWPSDEMARAVVDRLAAHHHPFPVQHLSYPEAGHGIGPPYSATTATTTVSPWTGQVMAFGGTAEANARANADSWPRVLTFLEGNLPT